MFSTWLSEECEDYIILYSTSETSLLWTPLGRKKSAPNRELSDKNVHNHNVTSCPVYSGVLTLLVVSGITLK